MAEEFSDSHRFYVLALDYVHADQRCEHTCKLSFRQYVKEQVFPNCLQLSTCIYTISISTTMLRLSTPSHIIHITKLLQASCTLNVPIPNAQPIAQQQQLRDTIGFSSTSPA
jgi:hypothetical protein